MEKQLLSFISKIIGYLIILFLWFRFAAPIMISYPNDFVVAIGALSTIVVTISWIFFISKTIKKFIKKIS